MYASGSPTSLIWLSRGMDRCTRWKSQPTGCWAGPIGSLVKVTPGASVHETIAGGLSAPYGVALRSGAAYVTTCAVCVGEGKVIRVPLD